MNIYVLLGVWLVLWIGGWWIAKNKIKAKQPIGMGWLISLPFLIVWMLIAGSFQTEQTLPVEPASAPVAEKVVTAPSTTPTIHNDPEMALSFAKERLAELKSDYAKNEVLYQNKDTQGLRDIRSELLNAIEVDEYKPPSEMHFFMGCYEAYNEIVPINSYYIGDSIHQDGYNVEQIADHKANYEYWLGLCEENIKSSSEL